MKKKDGFLIDVNGRKSHKRLLACSCVFTGLVMAASTPWLKYPETLVEMILFLGLSLAGATMAERPRRTPVQNQTPIHTPNEPAPLPPPQPGP